MSARQKRWRAAAERTIETVFQTLFPWADTPDALGGIIKTAHTAFLAWVGVYYTIYMITGRISWWGWLALVGIFGAMAVQFLLMGVCVFSAVEKRLLGSYVDCHGPWLRRVGLGRWKRWVLLAQYSAMAISLVVPLGLFA